MNGSRVRIQPVWAVIVTVMALIFAFVGSALFSLPPLEPALGPDGVYRYGPVDEPVRLWVGLLIAAVFGAVSAFVTSLGAVREPEVVENVDHWTVRLGWRFPVEAHAPVAIIPAIAGFVGWALSFSQPVIDAGGVLTAAMLAAGSLTAWFLYGRNRLRTETITIRGDAFEVDGVAYDRRQVTAVKWLGWHQHDRRVVLTDGRTVALAMVGNRASTRALLTEVLLKGADAPLGEIAMEQQVDRSGATNRLALLGSWLIVFPLVVLAGSVFVADLFSVKTGQAGIAGWAAFTVVPALLFGLVGLRPRVRGLAAGAERYVFRPGGEGMAVRVLTQAWLAWMAALCIYVSMFDAVASQAQWFSIAAGALSGALLIAAQVARRTYTELQMDAQGVVLVGRTRRRIDWSEIVGVRRDGRLFQSLVLMLADDSEVQIPIGASIESEATQVQAFLLKRFQEHPKASDAEREEAARAAGLASATKRRQ